MSRRHSRTRAEVPQQGSPVSVVDPRRSHLVGKIRTHVKDLIEPWTGIEYQQVGDRQEPRRIDHPSLLVQLATQRATATSRGGSSSTASKPPSSLDGVSLLGEIERGAERWAQDVLGKAFVAGVRCVPTSVPLVEVFLTQLAKRAPVMDTGELAEFADVVLRWWATARVATSWEATPIRPHVPCPECGVWDKLRIVTGPTSAICRGCDAAWDSETVYDLGAAVMTALELLRGPDVVATFVDRGPRGAGRAGPFLTPTSAEALSGVGPEKIPALVSAGVVYAITDGTTHLDYNLPALDGAGTTEGQSS